MNKTKTSTSLEAKVFRWVFVSGLIFVAIIIFLLWKLEVSRLAFLTAIPFLITIWLYVAFHVKNELVRHFFSLANVIESLRLGDYSLRIASKDENSAWSEVYREVNLFAEQHQQKRLLDVEANILLDKLLAEFDVPVFIFDRNNILKNCNEKGCQLFIKPKTDLIGLNTTQLHLEKLLQNQSGTVVQHWFPSQVGRWELRKNFFIQNGKRFSLVLINDLSRTLREEERNAWNRLIRVLGHELNNSLASLISVSQTLLTRLDDEKDDQWHNRFEKALNLIHERSDSLLRFTDSYTRLAKLPPPNKSSIELSSMIKKLTELVDGQFELNNSHPIQINADPDQLEQMLINLMKNAFEASAIDNPIKIEWQKFQQGIRIQIIDSGIGLPSSDNLFVPFYTTKEHGSGIGLFLCRQIVEAHDGTLQLVNRKDEQGCIAECWLPFDTKNN
ncbi:histidine kinase [Aliikangiella marina]|uniref:histidine kinase n=1 Tax=Aliikangiella marina TaxID=1712262 RepID=A0A545T1H5_9GAMM|nr:ATP-binding protein [Aliikangiella marina]TQV71074.1 histidine kinase [Aliikangiella marina]